MNDTNNADQPTSSAPGPAAGRVRLRVDERGMSTSYTNAYRTHLTNEEVMIDFGLNMVEPGRTGAGDTPEGAAAGDAALVFHANDRVIMNYYTAKRLALTLGQVVRQYEQRFGELKLDAADRVQRPAD